MAAMSGKADCFKILPRKNRATKAWNPHSASIMQRAELGGTALRVARLRESGIVHRRKGQRVGGTAVSAAGIFAFDALMQRNCANQCP